MNRLLHLQIQRRFAGEEAWQDVDDIVADLATNNHCRSELAYRRENEGFDFAEILLARESVYFMFCTYRIKPSQKETLFDEAIREHTA